MTTALVIIDVQNAVLHWQLPPERQRLVDAAQTAMVMRLQGALKQARAAGAPVVFVQHNEPASEFMAKGSPGWQVRAEIAPLTGEAIVQKLDCDSFHGTNLLEHLQAAGVTRLVICGNATQFCIDTTCRRAVGLGYDVVLLSDGHMGGDFGGLSFEQIVAHHNAVLNGFSAGTHRIELCPAAEVTFDSASPSC